MSTTKVTDAMIDAVAASKLTGALPAISGASLTNLDARDLENALPAISGASLTSLDAGNLGSGTASVARGGTGAATHTANNVLVGNGTSAIASVAPSTSGNVLTSNGSAWASTAAAGGGKVQQIVYNKYYNDNNSTNTFPWDSTIPQIGEGWEPDDMDVTITPTSASSILRIDIQLAGSLSASNPAVLIIALFQDSTADALAATAAGGMGTWYSVAPPTFLTISHPMVAGTTSATTFKTRLGASSGTSYIGKGHGGATLGGPLCSSIIVTEYSP